MRPTERGEEVVEGRLVRDVNRCELDVRLQFLVAEDVIDSDTNVKEISSRDTRRIVVGIKRPWGRDRDTRSTVRSRAG